jgi:hypothetical protein
MVWRPDSNLPILRKFYEVIPNYLKQEKRHTVTFIQTNDSARLPPPKYLLV